MLGRLLERLEELTLTRLGLLLAGLVIASQLVAVGTVASEQVRRGQQMAELRAQQRSALIDCMGKRGRAAVDTCLADATPRRAAHVELVRLDAAPEPSPAAAVAQAGAAALAHPIAYYRN